eukprot:440144-Hanusia_phi.AAC.1
MVESSACSPHWRFSRSNTPTASPTAPVLTHPLQSRSHQERVLTCHGLLPQERVDGPDVRRQRWTVVGDLVKDHLGAGDVSHCTISLHESGEGDNLPSNLNARCSNKRKSQSH